MTVRTLALALVLTAVLPGVAAADTFCVADTSCPADHRFGSIAAAFTAANGNGAGTLDTVRIGAGTFHEAVTASASNPVQLIGAGRSQTTIDGTGADSETLVNLQSPQSVVSSIGVHMRANSVTGIHATGGTVRSSLAQGDPSDTQTVGIDGTNGATIEADTTTSSAATGIGVRTGGTPTATVTDTSATADQAFFFTGPTTAQRISAHGASGGVVDEDAAVTVDDALVVVAHDDGIGVEAFTAGNSGSAQIRLHAATIAMSGSGTYGIAASSSDPNTATVHAANTVIVGADVTLAELALIGSPIPQVDATFSDFDPSKTSPAGIGAGTGNIDVDPGFVDAAHGDFGLRADSPLIDAGSALGNNESTTDELGNPRVVDGDGDGTAVRDIGALEFQDAAPVATASADPAGATTGQAIAFSSSAMDADVGDTLAYSWSCDDGATGAGASLSHAFAVAGAHTCTVTARDRAGKTGTADAAVTVTAPQSTTTPPPTTTGGGTPPPTTTVFDPGLSFAHSPKTVKLSKKGAYTWKFAAKPGVSGTVTFAGKHLRLGKASFKTPAGGGVEVTVKLSKALRKKVKKLTKVKVTATIVVGAVTKTATFTLKA